MSDSLKRPDTDTMIKFLRVYFGGSVEDGGFIEADYVSKNNHHVFQVKGLAEDVSVPLQRPTIAIETFHWILRCAEISKKQFRELAGTPGKIKAFIKKGRRRQREAGK